MAKSTTTWIALASTLTALVACGGILALIGNAPTDRAPERLRPATPPVLEWVEGDLRYTYHVMSGSEALFDLKADPRRLRNLMLELPETGARLRLALETSLKVDSLDEYREAHRREIENLEALGYL